MRNEKCRQNTSDNYHVIESTSDINERIEDFFYDTFYLPEELGPLPRDIIYLPYYQRYYRNLGSREGDFCFEAYDASTNETVGIVWTRMVNDSPWLGSVPYLLIAVAAPHRGRGIGSLLMSHILAKLRNAGYTKVALSVHRQNRAITLYKRLGFSVCGSDDESYTMIRYL